jgi:hypothetical protein
MPLGCTAPRGAPRCVALDQLDCEPLAMEGSRQGEAGHAGHNNQDRLDFRHSLFSGHAIVIATPWRTAEAISGGNRRLGPEGTVIWTRGNLLRRLAVTHMYEISSVAFDVGFGDLSISTAYFAAATAPLRPRLGERPNGATSLIDRE